MMNFLYTITIYPLELAYRYIYLLSVELIGSYGLSLFVLALISTAIYTPLKKMASKAQDRERHIQEIMAPQIAKIKEESSGSVQHQRIAKLYYRYAYHPIFALRSIFGVALQLPFLCAAYYMLSTLPDIEGQSFWIISNLGKPDALLGGINALPLLMTLFNIVATYTTPNFSRKERLQAVVVALLFLALLYNAPSALLLYWTANNALLCLQSLIGYKKSQAGKNATEVKADKAAKEKKKAKAKVKVKEPLYVKVLALISAAMATFYLIFAGIMLFYVFGAPNEEIIGSIAIIILALIPFVVFLNQSKTQKLWALKASVVIISWLVVMFNIVRIRAPITLPGIDKTFDKLEVQDMNPLFITVGLLGLLTIIPFNRFAYLKHKVKVSKLFGQYDRGLYFSAAGTLGLLVIFFSPSALYISAPDFFQATLSQLLFDLIPYFIGYFAVITLIWFISPKLVKKYLTAALLFITAVSLLDALLFNGSYGALDGLLFNNIEYFGSAFTIIYDLLAVIAAIALIYYVNKYRFNAQLMTGLNLATCSLALFCVYNVYITATGQIQTVQAEQHDPNALPDYNDRLYGFSQTEPNVLVFVLDMFTAGDMPRILEKHPELRQRLSGFTWYEDTVAVGSGTVMSVPSIYAGDKYTPEGLNKIQVGETNSNKKAKSLSILTNQFNRKNFDVSILETPIVVPTPVIEEHLDKEILFVPKLSSAYTHRWMEKLGIPKVETANMSHYMLAVSVFRIAPHQIKRNIYREWQWFGVGKALFSNQNMFNTLSNTAAFALLPEVANNKSEKGTLKFIYSLFPHTPWHLPEDSLIPVAEAYPYTNGQETKVDGYYPSHYYTEQHLMLLLADFFDWMKANNVYDNTMIVLVADHDQSDSVRLAFKDKPLGMWVRPHALLMVKDLNQHAPLAISEDLRATSDVAPMICKLIDGCDDVGPLINDPKRVRKHYVAVDKQNADFFDKFIRYDEYVINGTMFEADNWSVNKYQE
jgi:membrane protein insertase Oxa1/YidC/SpoIIIJ